MEKLKIDKMTPENRKKVLEDYESVKKQDREVIKKLGKKITDRIGKPIDTEAPEYWALASILTDEQAEIMLKMDVRKPITLEELLKRTGLEKDYLEEQLHKLSVMGMLEYNWENPQHIKQYVLPRFVPGSAEFMVMNKNLVEEHPIVTEFFDKMTRLPLEKVTPMVPPGGSGIGMHVIPVEKAIPAQQESVSVEHISYWLDKYKDKYAVGACSCRRQQRVRGEGTGDIEGDLCIGVGDMADYIVETDKGRYIDKEEVLEIIERAEKNGYVHQITNIDGEDKIFAICNCAPGVCNAIRTSQLFNTPNMSRSAYIAHVDKDKCVACGKCVEICPVGAAKLGQKLCSSKGPIEYPKSLLPDKTKWGKDKWNYNFRDDAKINVYNTGTAPCKTACPAHLAVQGYVKMASEGRYLDALKLIKQDNPFPAVCGAICNRRCEQACTRSKIDDALAVDEIKKFIAEQELNSETRYIPVCENHEGKQFSHKIAIIGAGPAGMTAAYYLRTRGYPVTIFEKEKIPGGMLTNGIPSFRLEKKIIEAEIDILKEMGIEFKFGIKVGKDLSIDDLRNDGFKAFYLAIGAQGGRLAGIKGEESQGVYTGIDFLRQINQDPNSIKLEGKTVVIGGGNVAIDVARAAIRRNSDEVEMFCLESREQMPASEEEIEEALEENILISNGYGPVEIKAESGKVKSVIFRKCLSTHDEDGNFNPKFDDDDRIEVACSNVILSIGQTILWGDLLKGTNVKLNKNNTVKADNITFQTDEKDIFVGGDVYTGPSFAIDAIAQGKLACESIHRFVHEGHSLTLGRDLRQFKEFDKDDAIIESFDTAKRQIPGRKKGISTESFHDLRSTFTEEQVKIEANRCLSCGLTVVDENRCIGCGLCTTKCEFDAISLSRDIPEASKMRTSEDKLKGVLPYAAKRAIKILFNGNRK